MRPTHALVSLAALTTLSCAHGPGSPGKPATEDFAARGRALAQRLIIADGHVDVPYRLQETLGPDGEPTEDISQRTAGGDFDYPRAVEGGLDVPFMSIYIPAALQEKPGASKQLADSLIDMMEKIARKAPEKFAMASSVEEVQRNTQAGKVSFALGIENGSALEDSLANVAHFQRRGVRYITLTHSKDNLISDASFNSGKRTWNGISPFGRQVVAEMNRVGIMVDVAHLSDDAIRQVLEVSQVPVIASHSSCRHFTPGFERNISDELIRAVAAKGGVVMINFGSGFLTQEANVSLEKLHKAIEAFVESQRATNPGPPDVAGFIKSYRLEHTVTLARVEDVADHIEHVVKLVGIDHVGLGSDFDGVGPTLPTGLQDVSQYPNLFRVLLERGLSEADIEKIASGNVFRVWRQAAAHAASK
ncbi:dipeptidase [Stigmatella aurantiaca]|uniref:Microsomal dipeptidase n=1 Tax=Stigmatella aurantiaca (strain DW4/3-1) TaxID=378806 RepID=Q093G1_STIAD|nr:dipeptidase [Stigmatella aurantiaca]ADO75942.1 Microsomal dipeptidase [Stigmatella aurantiaca DW4/3-1]EAU66882.1 microsomal dipeptidase [Stigmatella aurantiaca DW4/3-1]